MTERRALVVGIDVYDDVSLGLACAASDAQAVADQLRQHADGDLNYDCRVLAGTDGKHVTRAALLGQLEQLFSPGFDGDALLYFSGHGVVSRSGGRLLTSDACEPDWGVGMHDVIRLANRSNARNILLLLDCCHAGAMASEADDQGFPTNLRENLTMVGASRASEVTTERAGAGEFTRGLLDALRGGAADLVGDVTPPAIFRCVERRARSWDRAPIYKTNSSRSFVVRRCPPMIERSQLRQLPKLFSTPEFRYQLDPEYEPEGEQGASSSAAQNAAKRAIALTFKQYRDAGLLRPVEPSEQLYWTARLSHKVELTAAGREWWYLARDQRI